VEPALPIVPEDVVREPEPLVPLDEEVEEVWAKTGHKRTAVRAAAKPRIRH
jgi:hypothetical protein